MTETPLPSRALLPHLPAALTLPVHYLPTPLPLPSLPRTLQLRGRVLLLSRTSPPCPLSSLAVPLTPSSPPLPLRTSLVLLPNRHRLRFRTASHRDLFLAHVRALLLPTPLYRRLRTLGAGASARVHLVTTSSSPHLLALKAVPKPLVRARSRIAHLVAERRALAAAAAARAPCIVRLRHAFETPHHFCFVTDLAAFGDLRALLKRLPDARFDPHVARALFAEALLALDDSHRLGFLFRDLKPANLLLDHLGHLRLADFGLVKKMPIEFADPALDLSTTDTSSTTDEHDSQQDDSFRLLGRTTTFVGTRRFMSPEHVNARPAARDPRGYGAPADVWAAGISLYLMLVGQYPFGRDVPTSSPTALYHAIQHEDIDFPDHLSPEAVDLLRGMLRRDAGKRLDIAAVKAHPWMRTVDWTRVRKEASENVPQESVLEFLHENGVEPAVAGIEDELTKADELLADSGTKKANKIIGGMEACELLGFDYVPVL